MLPVYLISLQCILSNIRYIYDLFVASLAASLPAFLASDRKAFFRVIASELKCCCLVIINKCNSEFCIARNAPEAANLWMSWPDEACSTALSLKSEDRLPLPHSSPTISVSSDNRVSTRNVFISCGPPPNPSYGFSRMPVQRMK